MQAGRIQQKSAAMAIPKMGLREKFLADNH